MKLCKHHLSLDQPAVYQIRVQGRLGKDWTDWFDNLSLSWATDVEGQPVTIFTGPVVDQAALYGLLYRLYSLGLPLLSVACLDVIQREPIQ